MVRPSKTVLMLDESACAVILRADTNERRYRACLPVVWPPPNAGLTAIERIVSHRRRTI